MNWYKLAQLLLQPDAPQSEHYMGLPDVNIRPYEPLVDEVLRELKEQQPETLQNVTDVNIDMGYGQGGSVSSKSPTSINLNLSNLKQWVSQDVKTSFDASNKMHLELLKRKIKQVIMHEREHVHTYDAEKNEFVGGEMPAERAEREWSEANPFTPPDQNQSFR